MGINSTQKSSPEHIPCNREFLLEELKESMRQEALIELMLGSPDNMHMEFKPNCVIMF